MSNLVPHRFRFTHFTFGSVRFHPYCLLGPDVHFHVLCKQFHQLPPVLCLGRELSEAVETSVEGHSADGVVPISFRAESADESQQ